MRRSEERTETIRAADGLRLFVRRRERAGARGRLVAVHGIGEHSGRYDHLGQTVLAAGLDFYAPDLRGHGRSGGRRGHVSSFTVLLEDLDAVRRRARARSGEGPTFLLGHSLGGLVVGCYVQEFGLFDLAGAVLVAPFLGLEMEPPRWKMRLGDMADRLIPVLTLDNEIRTEDLFRGESERIRYESDPLVHHRISARLWGEMRRSSTRMERRAEQTRTAFLIQLPGGDRLVSSDATRRLAQRLAGPTSVIDYPSAFHALYHDPVRDEALSDLIEWIEARLTGEETE